MAKDVRVARLNEAFLLIDVRSNEGAVSTVPIYREDRIMASGSCYLVLDFGLEEKLVTIGTLDPTGLTATGRTEYRRTGAYTFQIQLIDADTGEGLAVPSVRRYDPLEVRPEWVDTVVVPCSPRRPAGGALPPPQPGQAIPLDPPGALV